MEENIIIKKIKQELAVYSDADLEKLNEEIKTLAKDVEETEKTLGVIKQKWFDKVAQRDGFVTNKRYYQNLLDEVSKYTEEPKG